MEYLIKFEKRKKVLEGVVYCLDPTTSSNAMNAFVGRKERVRIPLLGKHCSLRQALVRHLVEHAGLGSSIDIKQETIKGTERVSPTYTLFHR